LLAIISLAFTFNNLNFHKSKFVNSANTVIGGLYETTSNFTEYLKLKDENKLLSEENVKLKNQIEQNLQLGTSNTITVIDSVRYNQKYTYMSAKIINNNYTKSFNFLLIDKGERQGISQEMAVINSKGIIGITDNTSTQYTRIQSILNLGDTIETGGKSTIFPEGIPIGTVSKINEGTTADNKVDITLFNDMSNLGYVYVIKNLHKQEIQALENE